MSRIRLHHIALVGLLFAWGCGDEDSIPSIPNYENPASSAQDFGAYAAIGNSLTAGFQSGAWGNPDHIEYSFPNQLARALGIENFDQVALGGTGLASVTVDGAPVGNQVLNFDASGNSSVSYSPIDSLALFTLQTVGADISFAAPRNFGIPGITLLGATQPLTAVQPLIPYAGAYMNATSASLSQIDLVAQQANADFITLWLGNNDVLGFVTAGGVPAAFGGQDISDATLFSGAYAYALNAFATTEYIVALNIPDINSIPYVTYPNAVLGSLGVTQLMGTDLAGNTVPVDLSQDFVLLSALSTLQADLLDNGAQDTPLGPQYVLDASEAAAAQAAVDEFNTRIAATIDQFNTGRQGNQSPILLVDMNSFFSEVTQNGVMAGGNTLTTTYATGGLFSLDGIHPSSLGYAVVANKVIETMNEGWGRSIEPIDLESLFGVAPGM